MWGLFPGEKRQRDRWCSGWWYQDCHVWQQGEDGAQAEIVECFFQGGHSCPGFGNMPQMMWDFAESHPKTDVSSAECASLQ